MTRGIAIFGTATYTLLEGRILDVLTVDLLRRDRTCFFFGSGKRVDGVNVDDVEQYLFMDEWFTTFRFFQKS